MLSFLEGTDNQIRRQHTDKLDRSDVAYKLGKDFTS